MWVIYIIQHSALGCLEGTLRLHNVIVKLLCAAAEGTPITQERVNSVAEFHISLVFQASVMIASVCRQGSRPALMFVV